MDWLLEDVARTQGLYGMGPILHPKNYARPTPPGGEDANMPSPLLAPAPALPTVAPPFGPAVPDAVETLPPPRIVPPGSADQGPVLPVPAVKPVLAAPAPATTASAMPAGPAVPPPPAPPDAPAPVPAAAAAEAPAADAPQKGPVRWRLFHWN